MIRLLTVAVGAAGLLAVACSPAAEPMAAASEAATPVAAAEAAAPAVPEAVNGWREYPLRDGVMSVQPAKWRTDVIKVPVKSGADLEYKLTMKKGQGVVYNVIYENLEHPGMMEVEFHGHTPKDANGEGDLMFYSKTGGSPESGTFIAPWDGIHGWWLKNDSPRDVVVKLELAGFYEPEAKK